MGIILLFAQSKHSFFGQISESFDSQNDSTLLMIRQDAVLFFVFFMSQAVQAIKTCCL